MTGMQKLNRNAMFHQLEGACLFVSAGPQGLAADATESVFRPEKLAEMDAAINEAISEERCPGGVLWFEHRGVSYHKAFGNRAVVPAIEAMTEDTIFDAASLTKVVACTPAMMLLIERGKVRLDEQVHNYITEFSGGGEEGGTAREQVTHTFGMPP